MNAVDSTFVDASQVSTAVTAAHVLAVDDDPSVRQMIVDYLGDNEIRVTAVPEVLEVPAAPPVLARPLRRSLRRWLR